MEPNELQLSKLTQHVPLVLILFPFPIFLRSAMLLGKVILSLPKLSLTLTFEMKTP